MHKNVFRRDILSFSELNSIEVRKQKDELFYHVANEYLYYKIHGIHAAQGLGWRTLRKHICMLLLRLRQFILVGSSLHRDRDL